MEKKRKEIFDLFTLKNNLRLFQKSFDLLLPLTSPELILVSTKYKSLYGEGLIDDKKLESLIKQPTEQKSTEKLKKSLTSLFLSNKILTTDNSKEYKKIFNKLKKENFDNKKFKKENFVFFGSLKVCDHKIFLTDGENKIEVEIEENFINENYLEENIFYNFVLNKDNEIIEIENNEKNKKNIEKLENLSEKSENLIKQSKSLYSQNLLEGKLENINFDNTNYCIAYFNYYKMYKNFLFKYENFVDKVKIKKVLHKKIELEYLCNNISSNLLVFNDFLDGEYKYKEFIIVLSKIN